MFIARTSPAHARNVCWSGCLPVDVREPLDRDDVVRVPHRDRPVRRHQLPRELVARDAGEDDRDLRQPVMTRRRRSSPASWRGILRTPLRWLNGFASLDRAEPSSSSRSSPGWRWRRSAGSRPGARSARSSGALDTRGRRDDAARSTGSSRAWRTRERGGRAGSRRPARGCRSRSRPRRCSSPRSARRARSSSASAPSSRARERRARVAAVDLGTNSTRLLVADVEGERVDAIVRRTTVTRLGEGVDASRRLLPAAIERVHAALREYRRELDALGATSALAVATSAVRDSANGAEFLRGVERRSTCRRGCSSGDEEARLTRRGVGAVDDRTLVLDVGGGSTELIARLVPDEPRRRLDAADRALPPLRPAARRTSSPRRPRYVARPPPRARRATRRSASPAPSRSSRRSPAPLTLAAVEAQLERLASLPLAERRAGAGPRAGPRAGDRRRRRDRGRGAPRLPPRRARASASATCSTGVALEAAADARVGYLRLNFLVLSCLRHQLLSKQLIRRKHEMSTITQQRQSQFRPARSTPTSSTPRSASRCSYMGIAFFKGAVKDFGASLVDGRLAGAARHREPRDEGREPARPPALAGVLRRRAPPRGRASPASSSRRQTASRSTARSRSRA